MLDRVTYKDPNEGYRELNRWTHHTECYEVRFFRKPVTEVEICYTHGRPVSATVFHCEETPDNGFRTGFDVIDLSEGKVRDTPRERNPLELIF